MINITLSLPTIEHTTFINVTPERVYTTLANQSGWDGWFTKGTTFEPQPDSKLTFRWCNWGPSNVNIEAEGKILKLIPNKLFKFSWQSQGGDAMSAMGSDGARGQTIVTFLLEPREQGTLVKVTDTGFTDIIAFRECCIGWGEALTLLKMYLEHGITYGAVPEKK